MQSAIDFNNIYLEVKRISEKRKEKELRRINKNDKNKIEEVTSNSNNENATEEVADSSNNIKVSSNNEPNYEEDLINIYGNVIPINNKLNIKEEDKAVIVSSSNKDAMKESRIVMFSNEKMKLYIKTLLDTMNMDMEKEFRVLLI